MDSAMRKRWKNLMVSCLTASAIMPFYGCGHRDALIAESTRVAPGVVAVKALSNHYVEVQFADEVPLALVDADVFTINAVDDGATLRVRAAELRENRRLVLLTTDSQRAVNYTLNVTTPGSPNGVVSSSSSSPTFEGSLSGEMALGYAVALNNTTVLLTFGSAVDSVSAATTSNYRIADPDLTVTGAVRGSGSASHTVTLTTGSQSDVPYTISVTNVLSNSGGKLIDPDFNIASFHGIDVADATQPQLVRAEALDYQSVRLTFSEPLENHATDLLNYTVSPSLSLVGLTVNEWGTQATLSTLPMTAGTTYTATVGGVEDRAGNVINPAQNTATFGIPASETVKPKLLYAASIDATTVIAAFSEPMSANGADASNYTIDQGATVIEATPNVFGTRVTLRTTRQTLGTTYALSAVNLTDSVGNTLDPTATSANFTFSGTSDEELLGGLPRLTGAISTSNRTVVVSFNKPMSDSALVVSNYFIIQENQQPEAGYLTVTDAAFVGNSRKTVQLATLAQSELTYRLTVVNVEDVLGNQIAPKELLVDPATVLFPGTPSTCVRTCNSGAGNPGGTNGRGECITDDDCDDNAPCQAGENDCAGFCSSDAIGSTLRCELDDTDQDGLSDADEQRGWVVTVELSVRRGTHDDRIVVERDVTSNPLVADSDSDGLSDATEKEIGTDPRDYDTDDDQVTDETEYNVYYSNPVDQDSDDDGTDDFLEITFFLTSPIIADTDGDGIDDSEELYERNRHPLIADLPLPQVLVGDIALELNITSSYTDEEGTTFTVEDTTSTSFSQSTTNTIGTSSTTSTESENEFGQEIGVEGGTAGFKISGSASASQAFSQGFNSTVDAQTAQTAQQEYQESVTEALEQSESRSVTRNIESAVVQATVNLANKSDIAFSITNIELSMLQQDRQAGLTFTPIATLRPTGADDPLSQPTFNLGPRESARGPIIFENTTVFPNRIDALMREPVGLVFKVANFDVLDENGRNLVFTLQDVNDRTVAITLDFGDGIVESYRIATASTFGDDGRMTGITMRRALEIIGIFEDTGSGIAAKDSYETILDARDLPDGSTTNVEVLTRLRAVQNSADGRSFWTAVSSNTDLSPFIDFSDIPLRAHESILLMYTSDVDDDGLFLREEYLYGSSDESTDSDGDTLLDFDEVRIGWTVSKIPGLPYIVFPSPAREDSDLDGLSDPEEKIAATDPNRADSDEDGRSDHSEINDTYSIFLFDGDTDPANDALLTVAPYSDWAIVAGTNGMCNTTTATGDDQVLTPTGTGSKLCIGPGPNGVINTTPISDDVAIAASKIDPGPDGVCDTTTAGGDDVREFNVAAMPPLKGTIGRVCFSAGGNGVIDTVPTGDDFERAVHFGLYGTNPVYQDTDFDGLTDGREVIIGTNPNSPDAGRAVDSDGDGLFDSEEDTGWTLLNGTLVTSDKNQVDSDRDRIPDVLERAIGTNPRARDTDGDTLLDYNEFGITNPTVNGVPMFNAVALDIALQRCSDALNCSYVPPSSGALFGTDPRRADTDGDGRDDDVEINVGWTVDTFESSPYQVFSEPVVADEDLDGYNDAEELALGTDPQEADTDNDGTSDKNEDLASGTNRDPLRQDRRITLDVTGVFIDGDCEGSPPPPPGEFQGLVFLTQPNGTATQLENIDGDCDAVSEGSTCNLTDSGTVTFFVYGTQATTFTLYSTGLQEDDDSSGNEDLSEFSVSFTYPVSNPQTSVSVDENGDASCKLTFNWSIVVE